MEALARKIEQQGTEKGIEKVAKSMLVAGSDIEFIAKVTGMTEKEINNLSMPKRGLEPPTH